MAKQDVVVAIPHLDLSRYLGKWFEICRLPLKWEDETATDITARYALTDASKIEVDNRCFNAEGTPTRAVGEATPVNNSNSKLKVTFLPKFVRWVPFTDGDYWVLKLDPEYTVSLVGTPDHKYLWVLARLPEVQAETIQEYFDEARRQGFDLTGLIWCRHTGREVTGAMIN